MARPLANAGCLIVSLPDLTPPEDLGKPYEDAGFFCRVGSTDRMRLPTVLPQTLALLWVGDDWEGGLAFLQDPELPDLTRESLVLVGERPPEDLGPRLQRAGGLSWTSHPPPTWMPALLRDVVLRREPTGGVEVLAALTALRGDSRGSKLVLRTLAEVARGRRGESPQDPALMERRLSSFVLEQLSARAWSPEIKEFQVRLSPYSRTRIVPPWIRWCRNEEDLPTPLPDRFECPFVEPFRFGEGWAIWLPLGRRDHPKGTLFALFETRVGASEAVDDLVLLASDLELGARLVRQASDAAIQVRISEISSSVADPEIARDQVLDQVKHQLGADGVKLGLVRPGMTGMVLVPIRRSNESTETEASLTIDPQRGLADRVLDQGDWLLVESLNPPERVGWDPEQAHCGLGGPVRLLARSPESTILAPQQEERSLLWVPLHSDGAIAGVLGVWRSEGAPFDRDLDVQSLLNLAPHVAAASERLMVAEKKREEFLAIQELSQKLGGLRELPAAEKAIVATAGTLAESAGALGVWQDKNGCLYVGGVWAGQQTSEEWLQRAVADVRLGAGHGQRESRLRLALEPALAGHFCVKGLLGMEDPRSTSGLILLDPDDRQNRYQPFSRKTSIHAAETLLPYARALLSQHRYATASRVGERISGLEAEEGEVQVERLLQEAAEQLQTAIGADAVLIYLGDNVRMSLQRSSPDHAGALSDLRIEKNTLARRVVDQRTTIRVPDLTDSSDENRQYLDQLTLGRIREQFHLPRLRSWLCVPVVYGKRALGAIKVLTQEHGRYLGFQDQEVVESVVKKVAWELQKVSARLMLEELDQIARRIANVDGANLGPSLLNELSPWVERHIRPGCGLAIYARTANGRMLLEAARDVQPEWISRLDGLSRHLGLKGHDWQKGVNLKTGAEDPSPFPSAGIAAPLALPELSELEGHLVILHSRAFNSDQSHIASVAARSLAVTLNAERIRQTVSLGAALFRHALLGAVQGLSDAALQLAEFPDLTAKEKEQAVAQIHWENENIRFWSATQRLMRFDQPGFLELRLRKWPLKKLFDACANRYRKLFESRGIVFVEQWKEKGSLEFEFDVETMDLAISNLLHNAAKYAFYNRQVVLGAQLLGEMVQIWVEDVGHPLPDAVRESLYSQGRRYVQDPLRAIPGEGMGLYMVRRVVEAHEGRISHTCERERISSRESLSPMTSDKTPYRVRFLLEIPHHWKEGRRSQMDRKSVRPE